MKDTSGKFRPTRKQERAILEYLNPENRSNTEIARKAGISARTWYTWLRKPEFRQALWKERRESREKALWTLQANLIEALRGLQELMHSEDESIKLKACKAIIEFNLDDWVRSV